MMLDSATREGVRLALKKAASNRSQRRCQPSLTFQNSDVGEGRLLRWLRLDAAFFNNHFSRPARKRKLAG